MHAKLHQGSDRLDPATTATATATASATTTVANRWLLLLFEHPCPYLSRNGQEKVPGVRRRLQVEQCAVNGLDQVRHAVASEYVLVQDDGDVHMGWQETKGLADTGQVAGAQRVGGPRSLRHVLERDVAAEILPLMGVPREGRVMCWLQEHFW